MDLASLVTVSFKHCETPSMLPVITRCRSSRSYEVWVEGDEAVSPTM